MNPLSAELDASMLLIAVEEFFRSGYKRLTTGWGWPLFALESALQAAIHELGKLKPTSTAELVTVAELSFWLDRVRLARCAARIHAAGKATSLGNLFGDVSERLYELAARIHPKAEHYGS